jgi:hypothetical protein
MEAYPLQSQHLASFSVSLNNIIAGRGSPSASHLQHSSYGLQVGFSQTNSHLGLGHSGLWHFQSHLGSSQTASHSGLGT